MQVQFQGDMKPWNEAAGKLFEQFGHFCDSQPDELSKREVAGAILLFAMNLCAIYAMDPVFAALRFAKTVYADRGVTVSWDRIQKTFDNVRHLDEKPATWQQMTAPSGK